MRLASAFFLLALFLVAAPADAGPTVVASLSLDAAPSWQTSAQKKEMGSWVKHSSPVVADLGGGVGRVVLVGSLGGRVTALRYKSGTLTKVWAADVGTFIDSSPAVADLNGDGCKEVVIGAGNEFHPYHSGVHVFDCHGGNHRFWAAPGNAKPNHVGVFSTPAIGDVAGDGRPEVVYGSFNQKIYVKDANGKDLPGWPRENWDTVWSSPALADLNGDGKREIIIGTDLGGGAAVFGCSAGIRGTISVFKGDGSFLPGFPKCMDTPIWSTPAVQDVNRDGALDIVVGTNNYLEGGGQVGAENKVRAFSTRTGGQIWESTLPSGSRVFSSPAIGDVGSDGSLDVAVATIPATNYGQVYLLDARTGHIRWHKEGGHKAQCECKFMGSPVIADVDGDSKPDVIALSQNGGLNAWNASGAAVIHDYHAPPEPGEPDWHYASFMFFNSPAVADLDGGDGRNEIVMGSAIAGSNPLRGKVWIAKTSGRGEGPWPFFKRNAERTSAAGNGSVSYHAPAAPPAPAPAAPVSRPAPRRVATAPPTLAPTEEPTEKPTEEPTEQPQAFVPPEVKRGPSRLPLVAGGLAALAGIGVGAALLKKRRFGPMP